ncbi:bifunctional folylpolyglutamate synthase/dihydrofolate synthase [Rathayibacter soli]|uniref:bifunctional folylpolyglutamate synthase/dihydrofolate synthase n=1 Tax=Rathayibacter soli TaxID=3144168 RepID=UPI0027E4A110|nr:Mur ligase family protein [Glaciibacter superstes]
MYSSSPADIYAELCMRIGESRPQPRLSATRHALSELGNPHLNFPFIHVTGTNGKTTTSRIAQKILQTTGRRTGLFTSPHLVGFSERIAIDGVPISAHDLAANWRAVSVALEHTDSQLRGIGQPPLSFFEALTVLAYTSFSRGRVDCAVIEVGMGGAWDSTNVADGNVAVITPIALDHTAQLGRTVEAIARTKSGIIKSRAHVVCAAQPPSALRAIDDAARSQRATMTTLGRDFGVTSSTIPTGQQISVSGLRNEYQSLYLPLHGDHQAVNAALAIAAVEAFLPAHGLDSATVAAGLQSVTSPGRLECIQQSPDVFLDIAHNPAGVNALACTLNQISDRTLAAVVSVLEEKDAAGIISALSHVTRTYFVTRSASDRALSPRRLANTIRAVDPDAMIDVHETPRGALAAALAWADRRDDRSVIVTGSATLVGDVMKLAAKHPEVYSVPA